MISQKYHEQYSIKLSETQLGLQIELTDGTDPLWPSQHRILVGLHGLTELNHTQFSWTGRAHSG
jgi:hypothetical protein